jgi:prolipoprotein diacylglyceryltransferase
VITKPVSSSPFGTSTGIAFPYGEWPTFWEPPRPWAVRFPGFPGLVHPTQLYESGLSLVKFFLLYRLLGRKKFDGQVIALAERLPG